MTENIAFKAVFKSSSLNNLPFRERLMMGDENVMATYNFTKNETLEYNLYLPIPFQTQITEEILVIEMSKVTKFKED